MDDDLGVGLGRKAETFVYEFGLQGSEVVDDAVVDDRHPSGGVGVGMGVGDVGASVGGPAGVADPGVGGNRLFVNRRNQVHEFADAANDLQVRAVREGHPGRIVATVFEAPQAVDDDWRGRLRAAVADDSTHAGSDPWLAGRAADSAH